MNSHIFVYLFDNLSTICFQLKQLLVTFKKYKRKMRRREMIEAKYALWLFRRDCKRYGFFNRQHHCWKRIKKILWLLTPTCFLFSLILLRVTLLPNWLRISDEARTQSISSMWTFHSPTHRFYPFFPVTRCLRSRL